MQRRQRHPVPLGKRAPRQPAAPEPLQDLVALRPASPRSLRSWDLLGRCHPRSILAAARLREDAPPLPLTVIRYNSPDGSLTIDLIARLGDAFSFENLEYETRLYEGVPVCVATPRTLYEMKRDTVRLQDRADAQALKEAFDLGEE
jgi:hypothetical protein